MMIRSFLTDSHSVIDSNLPRQSFNDIPEKKSEIKKWLVTILPKNYY